jgi:hypothetical protein
MGLVVVLGFLWRFGLGLCELPAFGFHEVLGMLLAVLGFPIIASQLTFDDDLLAFLTQRTEVLCRLPPDGHVYKSSDLLTLALGVAKELIVSDGGGSDWSAGSSFSQGWVCDQVTVDDDAIDVHSNMPKYELVVQLNGRHRFGWAIGLCSPLLSRESLDSVLERKMSFRRNFCFQNGNAVDV